MLTRFSKYDFWIPGHILGLENIFEKIRFFHLGEKYLENFEILKKLGNSRDFKDFQWVSLVNY